MLWIGFESKFFKEYLNFEIDTLGFKIIPNKTKSNTKFNCFINILKVNIHPFGAQVFIKSLG